MKRSVALETARYTCRHVRLKTSYENSLVDTGGTMTGVLSAILGRSAKLNRVKTAILSSRSWTIPRFIFAGKFTFSNQSIEPCGFNKVTLGSEELGGYVYQKAIPSLSS